MSVGDVCVREVDLADPNESAQVVAHRMLARKVGTLVVLDNERRPVGLVTDRDLAMRVVAKGLDSHQAMVADLMTELPETVHEDTSIDTAITLMRTGPYRRLPVVDGAGHLVGLLTLDDVLELLSEELKDIGRLVEDEGPASLRESN